MTDRGEMDNQAKTHEMLSWRQDVVFMAPPTWWHLWGNCGATDKCQGTHYGTIEHLVPATSNTISMCTLSLVEFAPWLRIKTETSRRVMEKMGQCIGMTHEFLCNEVPRNSRNITETSQVFMGHDPHTKTHSGVRIVLGYPNQPGHL